MNKQVILVECDIDYWWEIFPRATFDFEEQCITAFNGEMSPVASTSLSEILKYALEKKQARNIPIVVIYKTFETDTIDLFCQLTEDQYMTVENELDAMTAVLKYS